MFAVIKAVTYIFRACYSKEEGGAGRVSDQSTNINNMPANPSSYSNDVEAGNLARDDRSAELVQVPLMQNQNKGI